jgi:hypothetical protein
MDRYIILLPLHYNEGSAVPKRILREALQSLYDLANGYTIEGKVRGAYRMKSGQKQEDELMKVSVLVGPEKAGALRKLVGEFCRRLGQESMWLEYLHSDVEFVSPGELTGDAP